MKIKPEIYAQILLDSIETKADTKKVAAKFWTLLQNNKQYKDLPKIFASLDELYASSKKQVLVQVETDHKLTASETQLISDRLKNKLGKEVLLKEIIKKNTVGYVIKVDGKITDLSLSGQVERLKRNLQKRSQ